jgi:predicted Zn-dependent peptidase
MGDTFNMSGDFRGAIVNIKGRIDHIQQATAGDRESLKALFDELFEELEKVPPESKPDAEAVSKTAERLLDDASKPNPNKSLLNITAEGLIEASKALAEVVPNAIIVAEKIARFIVGLA